MLRHYLLINLIINTMKKIILNVGMLTVTLIFASILSCSEQDESPIAQNNNLSGTSGAIQTSKGRSNTGRVGGTIFNSEVGDPIDLETAKLWASNYRGKNQGETRSHFFGLEIIQQILNESGCVGIRIYYAIDEKGEKKLLLVGVDAEGKDILPTTTLLEGDGNIIADFSYPCPTYCGGGELDE